MRNRRCRWCGRSPISGYHFCGASCRIKCREATARLDAWANGERRPVFVVQSEALINTEHICRNCGETFRPKGADRLSFCSRECAHTDQKKRARRREIVDNATVRHITYRKICAGCNVKFTTDNKNKEYHDQECYKNYFRAQQPSFKVRYCITCSNPFIPYSGKGRARLYCSTICVKKGDVSKKNKRINSKKRKMKKRGVTVECVDPIKVLQRDSWRCRLCKRDTPKELRGTYAPNAPEVDHIVPIAHGGSHSYKNTQCLCRSCNQRKGHTCFGIFG